ncbi:MAG: GNAT family N-acetyltransferase, partial [Saprospiraceae bacterium]|nr:GNAT family N-acetyltransferase [Saprospiraceae bacterium]
DGALMGAALFKRENGYYTFLSDMKTDANFFVLHRDCGPELTSRFFKKFVAAIEADKWALMLNHQPTWAGYMPALDAAVSNSNLYSLELDYSVCPVAKGETPEALFREVSASRNTRYKVNKLVKQEQGSFEVLTDDSDMDRWVEAFCDAHVERWATTPTPSSYRLPERRTFLKNCLQAWHADGVLVRFALRAGGGRIGFVAGLLEDETMIYHAPTFHPAYSHCSPGRVLIYYITQWMAENGLRVLDFGDGNEPYKYYVASQDLVSKRIFLSSKNNLRFIAKTKFIKAVRQNPVAYDLYQNRLKPALRNFRQRLAALFSIAWLLNAATAILPGCLPETTLLLCIS